MEKCATLEAQAYMTQKHPFLMKEAEFEQWLAGKKAETFTGLRTSAGQHYVVPVIFHIVHNGENIGIGTNLSNDQVKSQLIVLNEDFNRLNPDKENTPDLFKSRAGSMDIFFSEARIDPDGNTLPEPGVIRYQGDQTVYSRVETIEQLVTANMWDPSRYLNIWVVNLSSGFLGFAFFPVQSGLTGIEGSVGSNELGSSVADGVVIGSNFLGSNYTSYGNNFKLFPVFDRGRTTTHEVGHWLGLRHIWGDGSSCSADDFCADTPSVISDNDLYGVEGNVVKHCDFPKNNNQTGECTDTGTDLPDMFQNFMDYSPDQCMNLFTKCQVERMITVMENSPRRKELQQNALIVTDLADQLLEARLSIFPNPTNDQVTVSGIFAQVTPLSLTLLDASGKELGQWQTASEAGSWAYAISVAHLKQGVYFLKVASGNSATVKKLIRQ